MDSVRSTPREVIYLLDQFPADTLNFVYNEIQVLESSGRQVRIYSLLQAKFCPEEARSFDERTTVIRPVPALSMLRAWCYYLVRRPLTLLGLLVSLPMDDGLRRPGRAAKTLGHLAIGVYVAWLIRGRHQHVHAHFAARAATAALVAARLNRTTFSFTSHGSATVFPDRRLNLGAKVRAADFVVAVSDFNKTILIEACPGVALDKIEVNRTGVLLEQFPQTDGQGRPDDEFVIICVASLFPVKNHDGLLKACGELAKRGVPVKLHLVGKDSHGLGVGLESLAHELGIRDQVAFHGSVDHGQIWQLLGQSHVAVLASFSEGIPVSLMEAMASGLPVVGPRVTGVPELIDHGVSGLLADPANPESFADALERLYRDRNLREALGRAGRQKVETEFDMARNAMKLSEIFDRRLDS